MCIFAPVEPVKPLLPVAPVDPVLPTCIEGFEGILRCEHLQMTGFKLAVDAHVTLPTALLDEILHTCSTRCAASPCSPCLARVAGCAAVPTQTTVTCDPSMTHTSQLKLE